MSVTPETLLEPTPPDRDLDADGAARQDLAVRQDRAVRQGRGGRNAMPAWIYHDPRLPALEWERLLRPSWQIACHRNSIPATGDVVVVDLGPDSVLVLRDRDGSLRAFHNACRHRGARLVEHSGSCPGRLTCPYHGWTYRTDGELMGVPARETFDGLDRSALGLRPVATSEWQGFVFVCLADAPPPTPAEVLAPFADEIAPYRLAEMRPLAPITEEIWEVDWKVAMDNYLESYHVPIGHPGLARMFSPDYEDSRGAPGVARGTSWLKPVPSPRWAEGLYARHVEAIADHVPPAERRAWRFYSVLPNLGIDLFPEQMDFFQVLPAGPGRTRIRGASFGLPDDRRGMRLLRYLGARINRQVNAEDRFLCERVARGLQSSTYTPGPLSSLERWMGEFHDRLRARIPETALPCAPATFAPLADPPAS